MSPLISVIIPFFNAEKTIEDTILSVKKQTYRNLEIILVNDGSTDDSISIVRKNIDERFKIENSSKVGPGKARVIGVNSANGEYIFFIDADDLIDENTIEILYSLIERTNADVAIANNDCFQEKVAASFCKSELKYYQLSHDELMGELASCKRIQNYFWGKLFKRSKLRCDYFDTSKILGEDISSMMKIFADCERGGVYIESPNLMHYRRNSSSITHSLDYKKMNDYCDALIEKTTFYRLNYKHLSSLTFEPNIDFWFLALSGYDFSRIAHIWDLKKLIDQTVTRKNWIKLFLANHPKIARLFLKKRKTRFDGSKKKVAIINTYNRFSTGSVAKSIIDGVSNEYNCEFYYGRCYDKWDNDSIYVGESRIVNLCNNILVRLTGRIGGFHQRATRILIRRLEEFQPDIVHLHNIHGNFLNYKLLFDYLKDKKVVITMHDCFWITGRCAHFITDKIVCDEWTKGCIKCPHKSIYMPTLFIDKAHDILALKKKFLSNKDKYLVALSKWQKDLFADDNIRLIPNGFDFSVDIPTRSSASSKIRLIGVSQKWFKSKGIDDINYIASKLDPMKYEVVLIGSLESGYRLHESIIFLGPLSKDAVLKEISRANLFINPTYVDTFPTVLIESLCCGIPVITYDVGGCSEIIGNCGIAVEKGDRDHFFNAIINFNFDYYKKVDIINRGHLFDRKTMNTKYLDLYCEVLDA